MICEKCYARPSATGIPCPACFGSGIIYCCDDAGINLKHTDHAPALPLQANPKAINEVIETIAWSIHQRRVPRYSCAA